MFDVRCSSSSIAHRPSRIAQSRGFTLIEIIAVVSIIAILVAAIAPSIIRRVDRAAWTKETEELKSITDAYTDYIVRSKIVPGTNTWAAAIAGQMSLASSSITTNSRRIARAFLIDPALSIGGAGLPYTQTSSGVAKPSSARVILVSSLSRTLPIATSVPSSNEFNAVWNTAEGAIPTTATWTSWAGTGEDLRIKRLNLEPLFYRLILVNHSSNTNVVPGYSIENSSAAVVPAGPVGLDKYYLHNTTVGLHDKTGLVQVRHLLKRSISFMFESDSWHGQIQGDQQSYSASGSDFYNHAVTFFNRPTNPWGGNSQAHGASQWGVMISMYTFMFDYTFWANECPHFDYHSQNNATAVPEYVLLHNQGQNNGNVDNFSTDLLYHP
jgi:prepilin-type N-terminal cleavage/methylation domain-containing protein